MDCSRGFPTEIVMRAKRADFDRPFRLCSRRMAGIGALMTTDVLTVAPEDTLGEAAAKMTERGVGAVVVSDFGRMIGILSELDILRAVGDHIHSSGARGRQGTAAVDGGKTSTFSPHCGQIRPLMFSTPRMTRTSAS